MTIHQLLRQPDSDRKGWGAELAPALAQPELAEVGADTESARRAAYWLAVVIGNCRLRDLDLGKEDGTLLVPTALAAGKRLASLLPKWSEEARCLEDRLSSVEEEVEANDLCFDLLEARMEAWAVFVAIDESYQACPVVPVEQYTTFATLIEQLLDRTEELDRQLRKQVALLSVVAHYPLLDNWKRSLGQPYAQVPPWWLDGTLQAALQKVRSGFRPTILKLFDRLVENHQDAKRHAVAASPEVDAGLSPNRAHLNTTTYWVEGDDQTRVHFDLVLDRKQWECRVHLSPPDATRVYVTVHMQWPGSPGVVGSLYADSARLPLDEAAKRTLDHVSEDALHVELRTRDGLTRRIIFKGSHA